jgi:hypothetical protein
MHDEQEIEPDLVLDPGAYIGHEPELALETIPGGIQPGDERIAAGGTQSTGVGNKATIPDDGDGWKPPPEGHREPEVDLEELRRRKG